MGSVSKKPLLIASFILLVALVLAICVHLQFDFAKITDTTQLSTLIEGFFIAWSPALSALGTIVLAFLTYLTISEYRRSQKVHMLDENLVKIEEWARRCLNAWYQMKIPLSLTEDSLKKIDALENEKRALETNENKSPDIIQKTLHLNKELLDVLKQEIARYETTLKKFVEFSADLTMSETIVKPIAFIIGDDVLISYLDIYYNTVDFKYDLDLEKPESIRQLLELIPKAQNIIREILIRVTELRNQYAKNI